MVQIITKITCVCHSICFMAIVGFSCAFCARMRGCNLCNLPILPCPGKAKLGVDHPDTLQSLNNLALLLQAKGHREEAEPLFREALKKSPGAQPQRFQRDFGQWIWSHTLPDFHCVIRFLMTGSGAATLSGWFCFFF